MKNVMSDKFFRRHIFSSFAGGHARAPQCVHAPEAFAALHKEQAAQGAGRGGHLQGRQVAHPQGGF